MRKIRIAQIGTSQHSHGTVVWKSLLKQSDIFEVVGYHFPENEREKFPKEMAAFDGYREMTLDEILNDPSIEAVTVETEEIYLTKYAQLAADHGKHIHMEKPGGIDLAAFEKLINTVKKNKTVYHLGYMYRYNPYVRETIEKAKNGELGEVYCVEAHMSCPQPLQRRHWLSVFPGGMMFFLGCHLIDLVLQIMGKPEKILPMNASVGFEGTASEDYGFAILQYKGIPSFVKTCGWEIGGFERRQLVVCGTKGTVEIKPLEWPGQNGQRTQKREISDAGWTTPGTCDWCEDMDRYDGMMASFAAMVRGEKKNPYTLEYELELYKTVLRCCGVNVE